MQREKRLQGILILVIVCFYLMYDQFMRAAPEVATHPRMHEYELPYDLFGLMSMMAAYVFILVQIPVGILYDYITSRIILPFAIGCSSIGMFFMGWSNEPTFLLFARIFLMLGAPFSFISMLIIGARWYPHQRFGVISGLAQLFSTLGILVGGVPLHLLDTYYLSWRVAMIVMGTMGLILILMALLVIEDSPFPMGLKRAGKHRYLKELKHLFTSKQMWAIGIYVFFGWGPAVVFAKHFAIPFLMERFLVPEKTARLAVGAFWIAAGFLAPLAGYLSERWKSRVSILVFSSAIGLVSILLLLYAPKIPYWVGVLLCTGIGIAVAGQILGFAIVKDRAYETSLGAALGFNISWSILGGVVFDLIVQGVLSNFQASQQGFYQIVEYRLALLLFPIFYLIGLGIALFCLKETRCRVLASAE